MPDISPGPGPVVTVVVPTRNRRHMLADVFRGLAAQTCRPDLFEVVVLDNQSDEDIAGLVRDVAATAPFAVRCHRMAVDRGPVPARNQGVQLARGRIIAFTDSDCRPSPDWLASALRHFDDPAVGMVAGPVSFKPEQRPTFFSKLMADTGGEHPTYPTANVFYRRDVFLQLGGFDETLSVKDFLDRAVECADTDLAWRVKKGPWHTTFEPRALVLHEIEQQSPFDWMMEPTRLILLPMLLRRHPELAPRLLSWNVVFYRGTLFVYGALLAILLCLLVSPRLLLLLPVVVLFFAARRRLRRPGTRFWRGLGEIGLHFSRLVILAATLLVGSLRFRRLVL